MRRATTMESRRVAFSLTFALPPAMALAVAMVLTALPAPAQVLGNWQFSEAAGNTGTTADSSGQGYDGALIGFDAGNGLNGAGQMVFAANNANRIVTTLPLSQLNNDFIVDLTFTYAGQPNRSWTPLLGSSHAPYSGNEIFYIGKNNGNTLLNLNLAGLYGGNVTPPVTFFDGSQHRLVMTFSRSAGQLKLYADGSDTPFATLSPNRSPGYFIGNSSLLIGATGHGFSGGEVWVGSLDSVIIHNAIIESSIEITQQPSSVSAPAGTITNLAVTVTGDNPRYQWYKDTAPLPEAAGASLVFDPLQASDEGNYHVVITNSSGAVTSMVATVTITAPDTTPPALEFVWARGEATRVTVVFTERVAVTTASDVWNYIITDAQGSSLGVLAASLADDGRTVTLTTNPMEEESQYTLEVIGIEDRAVPPNTMASGTQPFVFSMLIGHWPLDGDGTDLAAGNHGVIAGSVGTVPGRIGEALQFDGNAANHVAIPSSPLYSLTSFTLSAWVYFPDTIPSGWRTIVEHNRSGANWYGLWKASSGNRFHFRWGNLGTVSADFTTDIIPDQWYHVAATYEDNVAMLYLDGQLIQTVPDATAPTSITPAAVRIGANLAGGEGFPGIIDDVRIYGRALAAPEIVALATPAGAPEFLMPVLSNGQIILNWTGTGRLEWAAGVAGPWAEVTPQPTTPPYAENLVPGANRYFRLNATPAP
jgi:hypothetical protein